MSDLHRPDRQPDLSPEARRIVRRLAAYLHDKPHAGDTAEGIACWWLVEDNGGTADISVPVRPAPADLQQALDFLVWTTLLDMRPAADGRARYHRASGVADFQAQVLSTLSTASAGAGANPPRWQ